MYWEVGVISALDQILNNVHSNASWKGARDIERRERESSHELFADKSILSTGLNLKLLLKNLEKLQLTLLAPDFAFC